MRVELAIATAILLNIPLRAGNLAGLELDRHLQFIGDRTFLSISPDETKNEVAIDSGAFASFDAQLLHIYINRYRPDPYRRTLAMALPRRKWCASPKRQLRSANKRLHCQGSRRRDDAAPVPSSRGKAVP